MKNINKKILERRIELGLSDEMVAKGCGLSIHEYSDVEQHSDEIVTVVPLENVRKISAILSCDLFDLLDIQCPFCEEREQFNPIYLLPRNNLISMVRKSIGLTRDQLADRLGFLIEAIQNIEEDEVYLEDWPVEIITNLSNELDLPLQILLAVKCNRCGR